MHKKLFVTISFLSLIFYFDACKSSQQPSASTKETQSDTAAIDSVASAVIDSSEAEETEGPEEMYPYQPERTRKHDLLHTRLDVRFDWNKQHLLGTATLTLKPHFYTQDSLYLDAKGFDIQSINLLEAGKTTKLQYGYDQKIIGIKLAKPMTRNDKFIIQIKYVAKPNDLPKGGSAAITEDKGLYFINPDGKDPNKPRQLWTQGETQASSCWFPTIDSPNERCTEEIYITVDKNYVTLSNGLLISSKQNSDGTRTDYWKQDKPHAPYLFMMAVGDFAVVKDKWNNIELSYWVDKSYGKYAKDIFGRTPEMLTFFSKVLDYPYAWDKFAQVVVHDYVSGAMENTTAVVFGDYVQKDDRELLDDTNDDVIAHEMFHHWFGDLVTCESWSNLPLNESFATYGEYLWIEHKQGRNEADYHLQADQEQYLAEAEGKQESLIRYYYADKEDMFDAHSYQKGGLILHMLRKYVGDEAFFKSLNLYLKRNAFTKVEIHDLRKAFEEVTGEDLNWFFDQWFLTAGHPKVKVAHQYVNGKVQLQISQSPSDEDVSQIYRLPVQVEIWTGGKKTTHEITINQSQQVFELPVAAKPDLVLFDGETQLLAAQVIHPKSESELVYQYYHSDKFLARYESFNELFKILTDEEEEDAETKSKTPALSSRSQAIQQLAKDALNDKSWVIRQMAVRNIPSEVSPDFETLAKKIAIQDTRSYVRAEALGKLIKWQAEKYQDVFRQALADKSYYVVATALIGYLRTQPADAEQQLASFKKYTNNDIVLALASYYSQTGNPEMFDWFTEKFNRTDMNFLYPFTQLYGDYLQKQPRDVQKKGITYLENIARNSSNEFVRFNAYQTLGLFEEVEGVKEIRNDIRSKETSPKLREFYDNMK
ncbi:M1 family aminopeptidase [Cytophagaceae bacterium YF14B1]|uniref:Aminopeptidase N n=1 Tax=Xanthocytophaga flava TaxID=3048013 RepID=A0AAE3QTI3_9BACT|nr:M1 family aminopeptidase [Xanthocytophaga flavus]MDJ1484656.1 M1 family aminopeptidase [Xanthocytophaga flavus]